MTGSRSPFHGCHTPVSACGVPRRYVRPLFWGVSRNLADNAVWGQMMSRPLRGGVSRNNRYELSMVQENASPPTRGRE